MKWIEKNKKFCHRKKKKFKTPLFYFTFFFSSLHKIKFTFIIRIKSGPPARDQFTDKMVIHSVWEFLHCCTTTTTKKKKERMHKTCTKWAFYHIKYFYLPQSTDEETKWNEMKSEERKRTIVMLTQQFLCFVGYRTCHQANCYSKMQRKKEDSKRQRHTQQFLRMVNLLFESGNWFAWTFRELRVRHAAVQWCIFFLSTVCSPHVEDTIAFNIYSLSLWANVTSRFGHDIPCPIAF